jgi:hypothetical protein
LIYGIDQTRPTSIVVNVKPVRAEKASGGGFSEHLEEIPPRLARPPKAEVLGVLKNVGTTAGRGKGMEAGVPEVMRNLASLRRFHSATYWRNLCAKTAHTVP